jgi:hypothetical protein
MDAVGVDYSEVALGITRGRARMAIMAKMYHQAKCFESRPLEICAGPSLRQQLESYPSEKTTGYIPRSGAGGGVYVNQASTPYIVTFHHSNRCI